MATKADFTEDEWKTLERGVTGSGMLVSLSDRDLTDTFGEVGAMSKFLAGQQVAGPSELIRELAKAHGTGFGFTTSPNELRAGTTEALKSSVALLGAKAPDEVGPYRDLVLGVARAVAEAKGGEVAVEASTIDVITEALGSD